jgi:dTDP-4-amino-4,6-dideoxygalactose transaminase
MTEMQAVIGRIQLQRMQDWTAKRTANAQAILDACGKWQEKGYLSVPRLEQTPEFADCTHAYYKLYVYVQPENLPAGWSRDRIIAEINALKVPCFSGSASEVYREKAFDDTGLRPDPRLSIAKQMGETSVMFLVHPTLTSAEIEKAVAVIETVMKKMHESK